MQARHQVSRAAVELIKRFEGFREKAAQLPDGRWTLGYGHTLTARQGADVSERDAEALLMYDLIAVANAVNEHVYAPLSQNQFDALCAFAFNVGLENFRRSSVLKLINQGQPLKAACAMELWRRAEFQGQSIVLDALVRRRAAEKALFLTPPEGFIPAPTPLLPPHVDVDAAGAVPREAPAVIEAPLEGEAVRLEAAAAEPAEPSPPQAAAESVVARLEKILAEEAPPPPEVFPETAEPTLPEPEPGLAEAAEPAAEPSVDASAEAEGEPAADLEAATAEVLEPIAPGEPGVLPPPEVEEAPAPAAAVAPSPLKRTNGWKGKVAGLSALTLLGVLLLGGGVWWLFNRSAPAAGALGDGAVGWAVGIAGVLIVGGAAYVLLDLLGRADEELDELED